MLPFSNYFAMVVLVYLFAFHYKQVIFTSLVLDFCICNMGMISGVG